MPSALVKVIKKTKGLSSTPLVTTTMDSSSANADTENDLSDREVSAAYTVRIKS